MPELPEVETIRRDLAASLVNRKIISLNVLSPKSVSPSVALFCSALVGRQIKTVARRGKLLMFKLSLVSPKLKKSGQTIYDYLLIHLKMTGQLIYLDGTKKIAGGHSLSKTDTTGFQAAVGGELPNKHTRVVFNFSGGRQLFFNDLRKFGYLKLVTEVERQGLLARNYGPEPLTSEFSVSALAQVLKNKTAKVKALLLDQKLIAGLGNIYVDESLYAAGIDPRRPGDSLKPLEIKKLYLVINKIIRQAIKRRGTTFSDYVDSRGRSGNFSRLLKVYGRDGEKCVNCGSLILKIKVAGRGTHYCQHCQK
ncbi:bifunctional DNA-formamidopyrimidine glycosylase/DNA-(apurinic or apyrimidinic site) lyase [Candidatus Falkowbacteria bacterium]|nr:bifunctional DNA-formamidopyrimidine glycosylase/DNA-(apurinic or apyrimidinic site) lyase [Candidatus Falkowbacteria bacterium]NCQ13046.1 bifunctional DNA-formamidopyrimidine glycosylase/DNA-(apurinic or apyrimidinic site) lyase [Candidatus Falkowbacteria bacterium]OIO06470.1 MAG: DNA-formamidopyrimidine glycosylase [Candidatus Falkowbacteria bacterium CG1_02_37_21]